MLANFKSKALESLKMTRADEKVFDKVTLPPYDDGTMRMEVTNSEGEVNEDCCMAQSSISHPNVEKLKIAIYNVLELAQEQVSTTPLELSADALLAEESILTVRNFHKSLVDSNIALAQSDF